MQDLSRFSTYHIGLIGPITYHSTTEYLAAKTCQVQWTIDIKRVWTGDDGVGWWWGVKLKIELGVCVNFL